jgi:hypothetical protein
MECVIRMPDGSSVDCNVKSVDGCEVVIQFGDPPWDASFRVMLNPEDAERLRQTLRTQGAGS